MQEFYHGLKWTSIEEGLPPKQTVCLVKAGGFAPLLRNFNTKKFAKGARPVTHWIVLFNRPLECYSS